MEKDPIAYYSSDLGVATYDLFAEHGLLSGDVEFYLDCAKSLGSPILELGCGTGRITLPLAKAGFEVVGLDLSEAMLRLAMGKSEIGANARFLAADMTDFDLDQRFALAMVPARSFQHIIEPARQRAALLSIRRHLLPDGHLILDLFDPNFEILFGQRGSALPVRESSDQDGRRVRRSVLGRKVDPYHQTIREDLRFEVFDLAGACLQHEETSWTLRWSLRQEMEYLFELTGFEPIDLFCDFRRSPPASGREQLWILRAV